MWFELKDSDSVASPCLLIYPDRVEENISRMIRIAGGVDRLRPHIKTHKMPALIRMQLDRGITKFKCATIAEAEMAAAAGAPDVLLAYQPVGPNVDRFIALMRAFPDKSFAALADDENAIQRLGEAASKAGVIVELLLDIDCGQHRSGIEPGPGAVEFYKLIATTPGLKAGGLHVYDGHISESDPAVRRARCDAAFEAVEKMKQQLLARGLPVSRVVAGGTPTFPTHAAREGVECSPGTCVLWDHAYGSRLKDMDFLHAALVLTRVISKPAPGRVCLDLGHKAIASENPHPRVHLLGIEDANFVGHSEEHLVLETSRVTDLKTGETLYGIPFHICPTVALYNEANEVRDGRVVGMIPITARARRITI